VLAFVEALDLGVFCCSQRMPRMSARVHVLQGTIPCQIDYLHSALIRAALFHMLCDVYTKVQAFAAKREVNAEGDEERRLEPR
jgi:predicted HD phosphohydrolase